LSKVNVSLDTFQRQYFYRSDDPNNSIKVLKEKHYKGKPRKINQNKKHTYN